MQGRLGSCFERLSYNLNEKLRLKLEHHHTGHYGNSRIPEPIDSSSADFTEIGKAVKGLSTRRRRWVLGVVTALGFLLIINSSWNATPDSALYLGLGESIASGRGYVFNGDHHTFVPPGYPLIMAGAAIILGDNFLSYRIVMALLGLLTAGFGYLFITRLYGPDTGFLVGGLFAVNHVLLHNSTLTLSDVPFALFALIALNAVLSASYRDNRTTWIILAGLLTGLLPIIRINGLGVAPAAAIFYFCSWKDMRPAKRCLWIGIFFVLALAPFAAWQAFKWSFPVSFSEGNYLVALSRGFEVHVWVISTAFLGYFPEGSYALTGVYTRTWVLEPIIAGITVLGAVVAFRRGDRLMVPLTVIQFMGLMLSSAGSRYLIFLMPALYLFLALGILQIAKWLSLRIRKPLQPGGVLVTFFVLLATTNVGHNIITIIKCRTPLEAYGPQSERSLPFFTTARWLKANAPGAKVLTMRTRTIHYLSSCRTIALQRSGVAWHEWLVDTRGQLQGLITEHRPEFLFTDFSEADYHERVMNSIRHLGFELKEVPEASSSARFRLYAIVPRKGLKPHKSPNYSCRPWRAPKRMGPRGEAKF